MAARRGGSRSSRRWIAGLGLLSLGAGVGVLLGAVLDGPRLLVRRWTEDVQTLELSRPKPEAASLDEFEALQARAEPPKPAARASRPAPANPAPPTPPHGAGRARPAVASAPGNEPSCAEELIAELRRRAVEAPEPAAKPPPPPPPKPAAEEPSVGRELRSGPVVQVAAYREVEAAQTLVRRLRRAGYDAYLSDQRATGANKYRVRVQPPPGSPVNELAATLGDRGYGVWVTRE